MPFGSSKAAIMGAAGSGDADAGGTYEWIGGTSWSSAITDSIEFTSIPTSSYDDLEIRVGIAPMYISELVLEWNGYGQTTWNTHSFYSDNGTNYGLTAGSGSTNYPILYGAQQNNPTAVIAGFGDANSVVKHAAGPQAAAAYSATSSAAMTQVTGILSNATAAVLGTIKLYDKNARNFPAGSSIHLFGIKTS